MLISIARTVFLFLFFLLCAHVRAHSGQVALAFPVDSLKIDGDLSDWPDYLPWYRVEVIGAGQRPTDAGDFSGRFRVAYSASHPFLYVAAEARDQSISIDSSGASIWHSRDGCEVYLANFDRPWPIYQHAIYGELRRLYLHPQGEVVLPDSTDRLAVRRGEDLHVYEWKIPLDQLPEMPDRLGPGMSLSFDVALSDVDADGSASLLVWGGESIKSRGSGRLGDLILVAQPEEVGVLQGELKGESAGGKLLVQSIDIPHLAVHVAADRAGKFEVELPKGRYRAFPVQRDSVGGVEFAVSPAGTTRIELRRTGGLGARIALGSGKRISTGQGLPQGLWRTFDQHDDLELSWISGMVRDDLGNLWIAGSASGLARYDGSSVWIYGREDGLPSENLSALLGDRNGALWFGLEEGGVCRLEGGELTYYARVDGLPEAAVSDIIEDREGRIWIATRGGGIVRFDGHSFFRITDEDGLPGNRIEGLFEDRDGNIWIASYHGGLARYDGKEFTIYTTAHGLPSNSVKGIVQDRQGGIWVAAEFNRIARFDGRDFSCFTAEDGLPEGLIDALLVDRFGDLWIAGRGGLSRYRGGRFRTFGVEDGLGDLWATSLLEDQDGFLWVGFANGSFSRYSGLRFRDYAPPGDANLAEQGIRAIVGGGDGRLWFGGPRGLSYYDREEDRLITRDLEHRQIGAGITALTSDRSGGLWAGSYDGGLLRIEGERIRQFGTEKGLAHSGVVSVLATRSGDVWIGTWGGGVCRYDGEEFTCYRPIDGFIDAVVPALLEDRDGDVWIGTHGGLVRFDGRDFTFIGEEDGLPFASISALLEDREGNIWIGGSGLCRYDGQEFGRFDEVGKVNCLYEDRDGDVWIGTYDGIFHYDGQLFRNLNRRDGLGHDQVWAIAQDRDGDVWIGTSAGITRYRPGRSRPQIEVTDVIIDRRLGAVPRVSLSTAQDYLAFEFRARSFNTPVDEMLYRYRLEGYEEEWRTTEETRVEYGSLPFGDYLFEAVAVDQELNYSPDPIRIRVHVHLPYLQIGTGGALALLLILGQAFGRHIFQDRRQRRRTLEERNRILEEANERLRQADSLKSDFVANVSHELRTPLTIIKGSADNMLDGIVGEFDARQQRYLTRLRSNADRLSRLVDDLLDLSRIEAGYLRLRTIRVDVSRIAHSVVDSLLPLAGEKEIELILEEGAPSYARVDPDRVYQILFNLVNNAVKFTPGGGWVSVALGFREEDVLVSVRDTGPGIPEAERDSIFAKFYQTENRPRGSRGAGIGLSIARHLVELHGSHIWVESREGEGSTFFFTLPKGE